MLGSQNDVRGRDDWFLGLIMRSEEAWTVPVIRKQDHARFEFTMPPPYSFAEVHEKAVQEIEGWEKRQS